MQRKIRDSNRPSIIGNVNEGETSKQTREKNHTEMDSNGRPWSIFIECAFLISDIATIVNERTYTLGGYYYAV